MPDVSYELIGKGLVAIVGITWLLKMFVGRIRLRKARRVSTVQTTTAPHPDHDVEHRALVYLMNEKTESMLAALAETIEQERRKLGAFVNNPSKSPPPCHLTDTSAAPAHYNARMEEQILPLAEQGMDSYAIARQLNLPESEVTLTLRLHAA